jgi:hypothetical protein
MAVEATTLEIVRGDTVAITITVTLAGVAVDLTGASVWFTAKRHLTDADASAVFQLTVGAGIVLTNAAGGVATATILPAHTSGLTGESTRLHFDVQVKPAAGTVHTVARGALVVRADVTVSTT